MANQFFQSSKSIANLQRVLGIFCSNDKAADLYKQSLLDWKRERKKEQGNLQEAANDKRAREGGCIKNRLREPESSASVRLQVIKGGKENSYNTESPENQWIKGVGGREHRKTIYTMYSGVRKERLKTKMQGSDPTQLPGLRVNSNFKFHSDVP